MSEVILDDAPKELKEPIKITDEMTEYAISKSITLRKMMKKFEGIDLSKRLAKSDYIRWDFNKKLSDKLERKITREIIKVWERKAFVDKESLKTKANTMNEIKNRGVGVTHEDLV